MTKYLVAQTRTPWRVKGRLFIITPNNRCKQRPLWANHAMCALAEARGDREMSVCCGRGGAGLAGGGPCEGCILVSKEPRRVLQGWGLWGFLAGEQQNQICIWDNSSGHDGEKGLEGHRSEEGDQTRGGTQTRGERQDWRRNTE